MVGDPTELDDLSGVTEHPGWARIKGRLAHEWGPAGHRYIGKLEAMANTPDPTAAGRDMQLVIMVRREIEGFFAGIEGRVSQLQAMKTSKPNPSRRGTL